MRVPGALVGSILLVALCAGCRMGTSEDDESVPHVSRIDASGRIVLSPAEQQALDLQTATIKQHSLTTTALRFGRVIAQPQDSALIVAPVTGLLATPVVAVGASISEGDTIVAIEPSVGTVSRTSLEVQRRQLLGQLEGARAQVTAKTANLARISTLVTSGLATEADRAQAEATLHTEESRVASLRQASNELGRISGGRIFLRAPASGVIAILSTETGSLVRQGTVVARIVRPGPRWIDLAVPPGDPVGSAYRVKGVSAESEARLLSRGSIVMPDGTRQDRLLTVADASANLPPGATVAVEVLHETRGLLISARAIVRRDRQRLVFVEEHDGHFAPRVVEIGAREGGQAVVTTGLLADDRVVTRGAASLLGELTNGHVAEAQE